MKIGIDVHSIGSGKGGNETYYRCLIKALVAADRHNRYQLYATHPAAVRTGCANSHNFSIRTIRPSSAYVRIPFGIPLQARNSVDVYHAQFIVPPFLKCKTVTTIPDIAYEHVPEMFPAYQRSWSKLLIRRSAMRADHVITVSERSKQDLVELYGISPQRITVTYLAAGDEFYPREKGEARDLVSRKYGIDHNFVLYLGRLQGRKNLLTLLDAFARILKSGADYHLVLAGRADSLSRELMGLVKNRSIARNIHLPGYIDGDNLPWLYSAADAFVYPSLYEGFGLPVLEAMACGVPVVTSRGSAMEEIATGAAVLVDPLDDVDIANAMIRVLEDTDLRAQLVRNGLERSSRFSYRRTAEQTIDVYEKLCGIQFAHSAGDAARKRILCS